MLRSGYFAWQTSWTDFFHRGPLERRYNAVYEVTLNRVATHTLRKKWSGSWSKHKLQKRLFEAFAADASVRKKQVLFCRKFWKYMKILALTPRSVALTFTWTKILGYQRETFSCRRSTLKQLQTVILIKNDSPRKIMYKEKASKWAAAHDCVFSIGKAGFEKNKILRLRAVFTCVRTAKHILKSRLSRGQWV